MASSSLETLVRERIEFIPEFEIEVRPGFEIEVIPGFKHRFKMKLYVKFNI